MGDESYRVSDAEREQTVISLRGHLLAGRLTLDEFSERVEAALQARFRGDLVLIQQDLPAASAEVAPSRRKPARFTSAILGHVARRGRLRLRKWTVAGAAFGDLDFDLREATIDLPATDVTVLTAFGNVDVYVPEGVNVDVGGITIVGHRREWGRDTGHPEAPTVRIRTLGWFGTVDVWRVPPDVRGSYREIFHQLEQRQRELPA